MNKKILVLSGSARKHGNSDLLSDEFIRGTVESGHKTEKIYIVDKKINGCLGCCACQKNGGVCIQNDEMKEIYEKMLEADVIALAGPVYFYTFSAQLKAVMDRTIAINTKFKDKTMYLISAGQAPDESYMKNIIDDYHKYIGCFMNIKDGGFVFGYGTDKAGDVKETSAMEKAYEMGKDII